MTTDYDAILGTYSDSSSEDYESQYDDGDLGVTYDQIVSNNGDIYSRLGDKYRGPLASAYLEATLSLQETYVNAENAWKIAREDRLGAAEVARMDAIARMYEADALVEKGANDNETDLKIAQEELNYKREELELKYAELEFKYYQVDNVQTWQAQGMYLQGQAKLTEAEGNYAESLADANAASDVTESWDSAAGLA